MFEGLSDNLTAWLSGEVDVAEYRPGDRLGNPAAPIDTLLVVLDGLLHAYSDIHPVRAVRRQSWVGGASVMLGTFPEWAIVSEGAAVASVSRGTVDELIRRCCAESLDQHPERVADDMAEGERRRSTRDGIHLVLSSGGARGLAHIGVLNVLVDQRVPIARISAASAGAVFGAMFCAGMAQDEIAAFALETSRLVQRRGGYWDYLEPPSVGLIRGERTRALFDGVLGSVHFDDLDTPLDVIAADICHGRRMVLRHGSIADAVRASMGIAGLYAPWRVEGHHASDGGLVGELCFEKPGAPDDILVMSDARASAEDTIPPAPAEDSPIATKLIIARARAMHAFSHMASPAVAAVTIAPDVADFDVIAYSSAPELIGLGEIAAKRAMPSIRRALQNADGGVR